MVDQVKPNIFLLYSLRSRTHLVLIAPLFARAFLQVGYQVGSVREMKRARHAPSQLMFVLYV